MYPDWHAGSQKMQFLFVPAKACLCPFRNQITLASTGGRCLVGKVDSDDWNAF